MELGDLNVKERIESATTRAIMQLMRLIGIEEMSPHLRPSFALLLGRDLSHSRGTGSTGS